MGGAFGSVPKVPDVEAETEGVGEMCKESGERRHGGGLDFADEFGCATEDLFADVFDAIDDFANAFADGARDLVETFEELGDTGDLFEDFADATEEFVDDLAHARDSRERAKHRAHARDQAEAHLEGFGGGEFAVEQAESAAEDLACAAEFVEDFSAELIEQTFSEIAEVFAFADQIHHGIGGFSDHTVAEFAEEVLADLREFAVGAEELVFEEATGSTEKVLFDIAALTESAEELVGEVTCGSLGQSRDVVKEVLAEVLEGGHPDVLKEGFSESLGVLLKHRQELFADLLHHAGWKALKEVLAELLGIDHLLELLAKLKGRALLGGPHQLVGKGGEAGIGHGGKAAGIEVVEVLGGKRAESFTAPVGCGHLAEGGKELSAHAFELSAIESAGGKRADGVVHAGDGGEDGLCKGHGTHALGLLDHLLPESLKHTELLGLGEMSKAHRIHGLERKAAHGLELRASLCADLGLGKQGCGVANDAKHGALRALGAGELPLELHGCAHHALEGLLNALLQSLEGLGGLLDGGLGLLNGALLGGVDLGELGVALAADLRHRALRVGRAKGVFSKAVDISAVLLDGKYCVIFVIPFPKVVWFFCLKGFRRRAMLFGEREGFPAPTADFTALVEGE